MKDPKLLCLHGNRSNAQVTEMQCSGILELDRVASLIFLDAPFECAAFDKDIGGGRSWFVRDAVETAEVKQAALRRSLQHVVNEISTKGPFDGCYGFSQGAALASLLCEPAVHRALGLAERPFRFAVLVCAADYDTTFGAGVAQELIAACSAEAGVSASGGALLELPSLHLMGEQDEILASSQALARRYARPRTLAHRSGHTLSAMELCGGAGQQLCSELRLFVERPEFAAGGGGECGVN